MRQPRKDEQHRLTDHNFKPYERTTLALQPFEQWVEDWQVKLAELEARRASRLS